MNEIVIATHNNNKIFEIKQLMANIPIKFITLQELGVTTTVEENGHTLQENAVIKSKQYAKLTGLNCLSDDSGLMVDALNGRPGVHSARYGGPNATSSQQCNSLIQEMSNVPWENRQAEFRCTFALYVADHNQLIITHGICKGLITETSRGSNGFGYDPIFYILDHSCTMAELDQNTKNQISHRALAATAMKTNISNLL